MIPEKIWLLLSLRLSGEASPQELEELESLLAQHPEAGFRVEQIQSLWLSNSRMHADPTSFLRHMQRLGGSQSPIALNRRASGTARLRIIALSAIAVAAMIAMLFWNPGTLKVSVPKSSVTTRAGSRSTVQLPDGTMVWLNADSKLVYDEHFNGKKREVALTGEAFFDVSHDATRPFIIHTNSIDVKVLGTAFNVRSYPDEKNTETSVLRGSVEITMLKMPGKQIILKPQDKLVVRNEVVQPKTPAAADASAPAMVLTSVHKLESDSSTFETSWIQNKLAFDQQALTVVAQQIARWYDLKVMITDPALSNQTYSGVFDGEPVEQVLDALQATGKFRYRIADKVVTIY